MNTTTTCINNNRYLLIISYFFHFSMSAEKESKTNKMAFVLGYTGETGKALIREMSKRKLFKKVVLIGRREVKLDKDINPEFVS